jgi:hypothetical protein
MNEQQMWALAKEARQLTDHLGLRLRACPIRPASQYKRLMRIWRRSLAREVRRWRAVNPTTAR